jgi:hypothetical protein
MIQLAEPRLEVHVQGVARGHQVVVVYRLDERLRWFGKKWGGGGGGGGEGSVSARAFLRRGDGGGRASRAPRVRL